MSYRVIHDPDEARVALLGFSGTFKATYKQLQSKLGAPRQRPGRTAEWVLNYPKCVCCPGIRVLGTIYTSDADPERTREWRVGGQIKGKTVYNILFKK